MGSDKTTFAFFAHRVDGCNIESMMFDEHIEEDGRIAAAMIRVYKLLANPDVSNEFISALADKYNLDNIASAFAAAHFLGVGFHFKALDGTGKEIDEVRFDLDAVKGVHVRLGAFASIT